MFLKPMLTHRCGYALFVILLMLSSAVSANFAVVQVDSNFTNASKKGAQMTIAEAAVKFGIVNATDGDAGGGRSLQSGNCKYYSSGIGVSSLTTAKSVCLGNLRKVCPAGCPYRESSPQYWFSGVFLACRCF